ncbi:hypothetical protein A3F34_01520 [Candidatus Roizmanbacteria bacterium RIFCSPHIGHO2_12_FULL_44_10]|uniref:SUF system FeS cluster assembly SufBD core domain-containing protein n=1 Tax=Candidatus Roizmanbacteria bacterium RIFCSPHIGHO2_12_FULL_44_10 TaxID=1802054 RepID=A0A1F7I9S2_9BACT|nr:MAG: hypothetical protein A3F34_01520 [Candidatus Roizmanbacteria bacterium RIFCSPHIGHO2_12_FULL_44_10]
MVKLIKVKENSKGSYRITKSGRHVFLLENYSGTFSVDIESENSEVYIFGLYIGKDQDHFNLNTIQRHVVGNSVSDLLIKGVFFGESKFLYEGLIRIEKKAQKSNAYQKNQNLILSDKVFVDSRPFLEILANDVRCTHGSTTGKISQEQIFYLQARGLDGAEAQKLIVAGFTDEIFIKIASLADPGSV